MVCTLQLDYGLIVDLVTLHLLQAVCLLFHHGILHIRVELILHNRFVDRRPSCLRSICNDLRLQVLHLLESLRVRLVEAASLCMLRLFDHTLYEHLGFFLRRCGFDYRSGGVCFHLICHTGSNRSRRCGLYDFDRLTSFCESSGLPSCRGG